jgi:hypothetical protein
LHLAAESDGRGMNTRRILYHVARADFLERVRRYSFLLTLGGALCLCHQIFAGNMVIHFHRQRGTFNSAWTGAVITLVATQFVGLFGFFPVKNTIDRDHITGVGELLAANPISNLQYVVGKALSNFAVLSLIILVLAVAAVPLQWHVGEAAIDAEALFAPFLLIAWPMMALVAATAVLFETIEPLRGGFGNLLYALFFGVVITLAAHHIIPDPTGLETFHQSMLSAVRAVDPAVKAGFGFGGSLHTTRRTFEWAGLHWTVWQLFQPVMWLAVSGVICGLASICFDRFDGTRTAVASAVAGPEATVVASSPALRVHRLPAAAVRFSLLRLVGAELRLVMAGSPPWWLAGGAACVVAGLVVPAAWIPDVLMVAWIWPVLHWSPMGNREVRHQTRDYVFSAAHPLRRQLVAAWLAGVVLALLITAGVTARLAVSMNWRGLGSVIVGALFVPSLALALGTWTASSKAFEVIYTVIWYIGVANHARVLDFTLSTDERGLTLRWLVSSAALLAASWIGRWRSLRR